MRASCSSKFDALVCLLVFLLLGAPALASTAQAVSLPQLPHPTPVSDALRAELKLDAFYGKHLDLDGLPILSSSKVRDEALREAAWIIRNMLAEHPSILRTLAANDVRIIVMAHDEYTTDVPEQRGMEPKEFWDRRARGLGGRLASCGEENLLCFPGDPYSTENLLVHEFAHTIHSHGLRDLAPDFDARLRATYDAALASGLWKDTYAATNHSEYWAEAVQSWFDDNRPKDAIHNGIRTRAQLLEYDPAVAALCREVFGDRPWRYLKPAARNEADRAHLATYDPATAPRFRWRETPSPKPPEVKAHPLPLEHVRLTGGPLKHAQDLMAAYLLELDPNRVVHHLRARAGLAPKSDRAYGGWDGEGRQLTGHIAGHYLSAVSLMYAATGDTRFKERADLLVRELAEVQKAQGDGYIGALLAEVRVDGEKRLVDGKTRFQALGEGIIESSGFDLNGMWAPWYVQHKLFAGLRDAHRHAHNPDALAVSVKFAEWMDSILSRLSPEQIQRMLGTEFGGMNEVLADLAADTGDVRWTRAHRYFQHEAFVGPLSEGRDILPRTHGNTQVPKLLGELIHHLQTGEERSGKAARFFWERVVHHHSFATGGHGKDEYFGEPGQLSRMVDGRTAETCNVYNMLKLTRALQTLGADPELAEFHERALFNHVLASIDDQDGRVCYMVPVGRGVQREYQGKFDSFTCCVGTGMESHALHAAGIYQEEDSTLRVSLFAPSAALWKSKQVRVRMETNFPDEGQVTILLEMDQPQTFTLAVRRPAWAGDGFMAQLNSSALENVPAAGSYLEVKRTWKSGDRLTLELPMRLRLEPLPDDPKRAAILRGPIVLAGDLGPENLRRVPGDDLQVVPVLVTEGAITDWIQPLPDAPGRFRTQGAGRDRDVELVPFHRLHRRTYAVYWDVFTPEQWRVEEARVQEEREAHRRLEAATVAYLQPGEMQAERDFKQDGEDTSPVRVMGRAGRRGSKWFSFELPIDSSRPAALVVTYRNDEWRKRTFNVIVDGKVLAAEVVQKDGSEPRFYDVRYELPQDLVRGKTAVSLRFEATGGAEIATIFGVRSVRNE